MFRKLGAAALVAAAVAACGGSSHHQAATPAPKCVTMNCVLATLPPPQSPPKLTLGQTYGIDFAWSSVSASTAKSLGAKFGASYLSNDVSKNWTRATVDAYHAAGLKTVAVWETSATRAEDGFAAGASDAHVAASQAGALGMPNDRVIEFAVDCDCSVGAITPYFQGVHSVLGNRAGIYGGYDQVGGIHAEGLVGNENWQTYAWSRGLWQPASVAPLEQYLNGSTFDNDRALAPLYGQWPAKVVKPANPHHYRWLPNTRRTFGHVHARERLAVQHWDAWGCRNPVRRAKCVTERQHMQLLQRRIATVANKTPNLKHRAKRTRWGAVHYRAKDGHKTTLGGAYQQFAHRLSRKHHGVVAHW